MSDFLMQLKWWNAWKANMLKAKQYAHMPLIHDQYLRAAILAHINYECYAAQYNQGKVTQ